MKGYLFIAPRYHGYHGGYWNINECSGCGVVGMYEDLHEANACQLCGGKVKRFGSGKWVSTKYTGFWPFRKPISRGYWSKPDIEQRDSHE